MQVEEVARFVSDNARRVLGVDAAKVLPVSARAALQAKLDATHSRNGFFGAALHSKKSPADKCTFPCAVCNEVSKGLPRGDCRCNPQTSPSLSCSGRMDVYIVLLVARRRCSQVSKRACCCSPSHKCSFLGFSMQDGFMHKMSDR